MKRITIILLCLCALLLPGFTASDPEISEAKEVLEAYLAAVTQGNVESMLDHTSARHRKAFIDADMHEDIVFKTGLIMMSSFDFTIIDMRRLENGDIEAEVLNRHPDFRPVYEVAAAKVNDPGISDAEFARQLPLLFKEYLENIDAQTEIKVKDLTINLVKENSRWKIDKNLNVDMN